MTGIIRQQLYFLLAALCCGMALMCGYEPLRLLRWLFPHRVWVVWLEDLLYGAAASIPVFLVFYWCNNGCIRWYGLVLLCLGGILYELGISRPIRFTMRHFFAYFRHRLRKQFRRFRISRSSDQAD